MDDGKQIRCVRRGLWTALTTALVVLGLEARAGTIQEIIVFGDSLSDGSNVATAVGPAFPYPSGRFTNGPVWVDYLAQKLGAPVPTASLLGGTNYAFGYAQSGAGFTSVPALGGANIPNLGTQIEMYKASLGGAAIAPGKLLTVWAGANDFLNGGVTDYVQTADNVVAAVAALAAAGGSQILVGGLPLLDLLPATLILPPEQRLLLNQLTLAFNATLEAKLAGLQAALTGVTIHFNDVDAAFQRILADPLAFGLTNVTGSAFDDGSPDAKGYLFWDAVHPTTAVHQLIAESAFLEVVPEPSSMVLAAIAGASLLAAARVRRAA